MNLDTPGETRLTSEQLWRLRAIRLPAEVAAVGRGAADQLREALPALGDEEIAAVVYEITHMVTKEAMRHSCGLLNGLANGLGAITVDLAHLDVQEPQ